MAPPRPAPLSTHRPHRGIKIPVPPLKPLIHHNVPLPSISTPKLRKPLPKILQLSRPNQAQRDNQNHERERSSPEDPLVDSHVPHVEGVHAEDGRDCAQRQEDDGYDCEGVDGCFLTVFV
jgi:hypothetical protein